MNQAVVCSSVSVRGGKDRRGDVGGTERVTKFIHLITEQLHGFSCYREAAMMLMTSMWCQQEGSNFIYKAFWTFTAQQRERRHSPAAWETPEELLVFTRRLRKFPSFFRTFQWIRDLQKKPGALIQVSQSAWLETGCYFIFYMILFLFKQKVAAQDKTFIGNV